MIWLLYFLVSLGWGGVVSFCLAASRDWLCCWELTTVLAGRNGVKSEILFWLLIVAWYGPAVNSIGKKQHVGVRHTLLYLNRSVSFSVFFPSCHR